MHVGGTLTVSAGIGLLVHTPGNFARELLVLRGRWNGFCREVGALVRCNVELRDMNLTVPATDEREVEVVASGLPLQHGAQLAIDVTLRSALTSFGTACTNARGKFTVALFVRVLLRPCQPYHGTQGMDCHGGSQRDGSRF